METGPVTQYDFTVMRNEPVAQGIWRLVITSEVARTIEPGQFMNLRVPGDGAHILRIPLSFKRADAKAETVELLYAVVGEGTERLAKMRAGDTSTLVGPCGRGWWLPKAEGRALLVAGGIGLPPIFAAARQLAEAGVGFDVVVGNHTAERHLMQEIDELRSLSAGEVCDCERRVVVCTDDGTLGLDGFTTDGMASLLAERSYAQVYTCGPTVMMAGISKLAREHGIACQASMERMMGCGFGACSCCNVALVAGGYALCCQDGPVFDAEEVAW